MKHTKKLIIIYGPTGVGKTDMSLAIDKLTPIEIINGDVGQLYEPLAIGTAKPDWKNDPIPHHLFDYCTTPQDITVVMYRTLLLEKAEDIWARGATPVIVGGSGFYLKSLFYPPKNEVELVPEDRGVCDLSDTENKSTEDLWNLLYEHDPERAQALIVQDRYRILRALDLVKKGIKPSTLTPEYEPFPAEILVFFLNRPREELYQRIDQRVEIMMQQGLIQEVKKLLGTDWETFLLRKKLIGYNDILEYLRQEDQSVDQYQILIEKIQKKTRNYAKRQITFWRMLKKLLDKNFMQPSSAQEIDLAQEEGTLTKVLENFLKGDDNEEFF